MLAKIAHSYTVAELGYNGFVPFLSQMIVNSDTSNHVQYIGGGIQQTEPKSTILHEVSLVEYPNSSKDLLVVRIRLLGSLETPTYYIVTGKKSAAA